MKELRMAASVILMPTTLSFLTFWSASTNVSPFRRRSLRTCTGHLVLQRAASAISCATARQRYVGSQLTFHCDRKQIILERSDVSGNLGGQYVELYDFIDRPMEVRWKGVSLPYRVFSKDQRVSHTAIVENKRLGHALALVKTQQDFRHTNR